MQPMQITQKLHVLLGDLYAPVMVGLKVIAIIVLSIVVVRIGSSVIRKIFQKQKSLKFNIDTKRIDTMSTLLVSVFRYTIYIVAGVTVLSYIFKESILAAAGIGGLVFGLGAQSLIRDIISGFFIVFENQYVVGDEITIDNMNGRVEGLELRVTRVRNANGDLYVIPNGEIKKVTNHTRGNKAMIVDVPLAYSTNVDKAVKAANKVCEAVSDEFDTITEPPGVLGITEFGKDGMNLRIVGKTLPGEHWAVERKIRRLLKEEFDRQGLIFSEKPVKQL